MYDDSNLYVYVSEEDLKHPLTKRLLLRTGLVTTEDVDTYYKDETKLKQALYALWGISGMNQEAEFEAEVKEHRTRIEQKIVKCIRYCGLERTDKEWRESFMASDAVKSRYKNFK